MKNSKYYQVLQKMINVKEGSEIKSSTKTRLVGNNHGQK